MFFNYFKISIRLMMRSAFYSSISILGLTIGLVSFYILWLYSVAQLRSDQYHLNANRIARIGYNWEWTDDGVTNNADAGFLKSTLAVNIKNDFPEVEEYVRILQQNAFNPEMVKHGPQLTVAAAGHGDDRIFKEDKVVYSDANLFEFFSIPLIFGNAAKVLREPGAVVLSAAAAKKYFNEADPRGELLKLNDSVTLKVTGVYQDLPDNTHLDFDLVIANSTHLNQWNTSFYNNTTTYIRLKDGSFEAFETKLNKYSQKYWAEVLKAFAPVRITMFVQPLDEIAFSQSYVGDTFPPKSRSFFYTLGFISLSVLFMAWINHINLSISRTVKRFKEIAARKVSGANHRDMIKQFMVESALIYGIAALLALTVIQLVKSPFQLFFNIRILDWNAIALSDKFLLGLIVVIGIITSGLYPLYSSRYFNPASLFKLSKPSKERRKFTFALSVVQFSAAIVVIVLGLVVALQLNKVMMRTLEKDKAVVVIESPIHRSGNYPGLISAFRKTLATNPNIQRATACTSTPGDRDGSQLEIKRISSDHYVGVFRTGADEFTLPTLNIKLLGGRSFVSDDRKDVIIISRVAAERLGYSPNEAIGVSIDIGFFDGKKRNWLPVEVIGVIEEIEYGYHFAGPASGGGIGSVLLYSNKLFSELVTERIAIQIDPSKTNEVIPQVEKAFADLFPGNVFTWYFHDDHMNRIYINEIIIRNQIILFTSLAIIIASIGLLGLVSFEVIERKKEMGIRKIMGAHLGQIGLLLLRSTGYQILIAMLIAIPFGYFLSKQYLDKFSLRINLSWWHFTAPVFLLGGILLLTILSTIWRAARSNPVEALRHD